MEKGQGEAGAGRPEYSIIVPTYNERLNVAIIVYLVFKHPLTIRLQTCGTLRLNNRYTNFRGY